jgi:hypothetical protein
MNETRRKTDKSVRKSTLIRCGIMNIWRVISIVVLAAGLAGCGVAEVISNGLAYSSAVETDLMQATGIKPQVGFNWSNGSLRSVTVTFPQVYAGKPLAELADTVRTVVAREFKETPDTIVLGFALKK